MSTPDSLYVRRENGTLKQVVLGKRAAGDLFDYLLPRMALAAPDFKDQFEGEYYGDVLAITGLPEQYFPAVYKLAIAACDELSSLKKHRIDLQAVLQSDPRYKG